MYSHYIVALCPILAVAAPLIEDSNPNHEVAEPLQKGQSIQDKLLCQAGVYSADKVVQTCLSSALVNCCATGYLCTGGTASNPCCVAITDTTNTCGSVNKNACITPGYLPCSGANFCCPPDSLCYVDSFNVARCSPKGTIPSPTPSPKPSPTPTPIPSPKPSPTPTPTPSPKPSPSPTPIPSPSPNPSPIPSPSPKPSLSTTTTTTKSSSRSTTSSTTSSLQPTPTPIGFNSGSDSSSDSGSSYSREDHGFWTPAAIGGVAGGGAGVLILLFLLVCCCVRKRRSKSSGGGGGGSGGGVWTGPRTSPSIQPLSDRQIAALVQYRDTTQDWQNLYIKEGRRIEGQSHIDRAASLGDFATRAIQQRHYQLRNGGGQLLAHLICGAVGWIPGAKLIIGPWSTLEFTRYALKCFGMLEKEDVNDLHRKAILKAGYATNLEELFTKLEKKAKEMGEPMWLIKKTAKEIAKDKDVQAEVLNELNTYLTNEFGTEAAAVAMEDTVHFIPLVGHAYGAFKGIDRSNTRINKVLDFLKDEALDFHLSVFVMNVL